jgi:hypothetical protein
MNGVPTCNICAETNYLRSGALGSVFFRSFVFGNDDYFLPTLVSSRPPMPRRARKPFEAAHCRPTLIITFSFHVSDRDTTVRILEPQSRVRINAESDESTDRRPAAGDAPTRGQDHGRLVKVPRRYP